MDRVRASELGRRYKARALAFLDAKPGQRVLDVGCGPGDDAREIAQLLGPSGAVTGIDLDEDMIAEAQRRAEAGGVAIDFRVADVRELPFEDDRFDACLADRALQLLGADLDRALEEIIRVTRPGGHLVACNPDTRSFVLDIGERKVTARILAFLSARGFQGGDLPNAFRAAGLENVRMEVLSHCETSFAAIDESTPLRTLAEWARQGGAIDEQDEARWLEKLEEAIERDRFAFTSSMFVACGEVSADRGGASAR